MRFLFFREDSIAIVFSLSTSLYLFLALLFAMHEQSPYHKCDLGVDVRV